MNRRTAIRHLVAAAALLTGCGPLPAISFNLKHARIGVLHAGDPSGLNALRKGLNELGWVEGLNLSILERVAVQSQKHRYKHDRRHESVLPLGPALATLSP